MLATIVDNGVTVEDRPVSGLEAGSPPGEWLAARRSLLDRGEAAWLLVLADFDRDQEWRFDGQLSCVDWLVWRTGMSRGTAFEKVRIAHDLSRRPQLAAGFADGTISYSAVRAITRLDNPDSEVDRALIDLAACGTVRDVERAVRHYQLCAEQDRPPDHSGFDRRFVRLHRTGDGLGEARMVLDALEIDELDAALRALLDRAARPPADRPVDDSSRDEDQPSRAEVERLEAVPVWQRRAHAFMELVRLGAAHIDDGHAAGAERYMVHIVTDHQGLHAEHLDAEPLLANQAARAGCDATTVTHLVDPSSGETLSMGRRTRIWNSSQRRAITVRDAGTCRYPGCPRTICDIHHLQPWSLGGTTDTDNGLLICTRHHSLLHQGFTATGHANGAIHIQRPDGTRLATSHPPRRGVGAAWTTPRASSTAPSCTDASPPGESAVAARNRSASASRHGLLVQ